MAEMIWTDEAEQWLKEIHDYISIDNPMAAQTTVNGIYEKAQILKVFPEIGYQYEHISHRHIRILLFGHYRIAYEIAEDTKIMILGIFHGALKIENYLL